MMPDAGYGRAAGDFQIGQLVQVFVLYVCM